MPTLQQVRKENALLEQQNRDQFCTIDLRKHRSPAVKALIRGFRRKARAFRNKNDIQTRGRDCSFDWMAVAAKEGYKIIKNTNVVYGGHNERKPKRKKVQYQAAWGEGKEKLARLTPIGERAAKGGGAVSSPEKD